MPVSNASFNFVPTPSGDATRIGSLRSGNAPANIPPKLPISVSVRSLNVLRANSRIFATARFALSIETPASAYEIDCDISSDLLSSRDPEFAGEQVVKFCFGIDRGLFLIAVRRHDVAFLRQCFSAALDHDRTQFSFSEV